MNQLRIGVIGAAGGRGSGWAKRVVKYSKKHKSLKLTALADILAVAVGMKCRCAQGMLISIIPV